MNDAEPPQTPLQAAASRPDGYRVLARKHRPQSFDALIGQEVLVRTLTNAFASGRIAHAYMLSGVRGVGKTTTARIIARALNCVGPDGAGGVTIAPCGVCVHCEAIAQDRHLDVIEMDAASRSKVEEMRELLDGVRYRPTSARYKVYIIDEVHMLSTSAFNALLKTLEEPPEHAKFVFATTESRKVPVTVLSRCQRFDLRRIDGETLARHLGEIAAREGVAVDAPALRLLARAADGSVRDGLSLLDQAIAVGGPVDEAMARDMLGLIDRGVAFDLFEATMAGDAARAVTLGRSQYDAGGDPALMLEDLLDVAHAVARVRLSGADDPGASEAERTRARGLAERLGMAEIDRAWAILLKGLGEVRAAPQPMQAFDMALIRLAYASQLPSPADALRALTEGAAGRAGEPAPPGPRASSGPSGEAERAPIAAPAPPPPRSFEAKPRAASPTFSRRGPGGPSASAASAVVDEPSPPLAAPSEARPRRSIRSFEDVVELAGERKEGLLHGHLLGSAHLVRFEEGHIELRLGQGAPRDLPQTLSAFLREATGRVWMVGVSQAEGEAPLRQQRKAEEARMMERAAADPVVQEVLRRFPGAKIREVAKLAPSAGAWLVTGDPDDLDEDAAVIDAAAEADDFESSEAVGEEFDPE